MNLSAWLTVCVFTMCLAMRHSSVVTPAFRAASSSVSLPVRHSVYKLMKLLNLLLSEVSGDCIVEDLGVGVVQVGNELNHELDDF